MLHTQRGDRHFTALYSNTARFHELGMTQDCGRSSTAMTPTAMASGR
ncbi:MAG: hypothetical protein R2856_01990 [Caldilineaceae bacterium]